MHMKYLKSVVAIVMETTRNSREEKSLLKQLSYRDQALDHIDLTKKRINIYLETHGS